MNYEKFATIAPTDYAGALKRESFMDFGIKALWQPIPTYFWSCLHSGDGSW